jgi:hypothetical protein
MPISFYLTAVSVSPFVTSLQRPADHLHDRGNSEDDYYNGIRPFGIGGLIRVRDRLTSSIVGEGSRDVGGNRKERAACELMAC